MKDTILHNWNFMRFLRLAVGIFIIAQSIITKNLTMGILGSLFTIMPLFNIGCCGVGRCATPISKTSETNKDIIYEEVV